jgi:hypothetical protein
MFLVIYCMILLINVVSLLGNAVGNFTRGIANGKKNVLRPAADFDDSIV